MSLSGLKPNAPALVGGFSLGASDFPESPDHHARFFVNGVLVGDDEWNGKDPRRIEIELPAGTVREGENALEIESLSDTGALYSMFFLDRFAVTYSRLAVAMDGVAQGKWDESGAAALSTIGASARVLDVTGVTPVWLTGARHDEDALRFRVEAGRSYLALDPSAVKSPRPARSPSSSRSTTSSATPRFGSSKTPRSGADFVHNRRPTVSTGKER